MNIHNRFIGTKPDGGPNVQRNLLPAMTTPDAAERAARELVTHRPGPQLGAKARVLYIGDEVGGTAIDEATAEEWANRYRAIIAAAIRSAVEAERNEWLVKVADLATDLDAERARGAALAGDVMAAAKEICLGCRVDAPWDGKHHRDKKQRKIQCDAWQVRRVLAAYTGGTV